MSDEIVHMGRCDLAIADLLNDKLVVLAMAAALLSLGSSLVSLPPLLVRTERFRAQKWLTVSLSLSDVFISVGYLMFKAFLTAECTIDYLPGHVGRKFVSLACAQAVSSGISMMSYTSSLLTLLAMAVDHYVCITRPLKYRHVISRRIVFASVTVIWLLACLMGFSDFYSIHVVHDNSSNIAVLKFNFSDVEPIEDSLESFFPVDHNGTLATGWLVQYPYCRRIQDDNLYDPSYPVLGLTVVSFAVMVVMYCQVYREIQRLQKRTDVFKPDVIKKRKALITTVFFLGGFMVCWAPLNVSHICLLTYQSFVQKLSLEQRKTAYKFTKYAQILLLLNGLCDTCIYVLRMPAVRRGFREVYCPKRSSWSATATAVDAASNTASSFSRHNSCLVAANGSSRLQLHRPRSISYSTPRQQQRLLLPSPTPPHVPDTRTPTKSICLSPLGSAETPL